MHLPALLLFFLMSCAVTIYSHTDTVMLGAIKGTEEVGIYSCAAKVRRFGQADHYRVFGRDSEEMLQKAGFTVTRIESREADGSILPVVGPADYDVNYLFLCGKCGFEQDPG